ncbi:MAG: hypothetical protein ABI744_01650 [Chloroflexota bacterium]
MARAKNTSRSEARRRNRDDQRALLTEDDQLDDQIEADEAAPAPRTALFKMPNIVEDARQLPGMFRAKPMLWVPFLLVLVGFVLALVIYGVPVDLQTWIALYLQFFLVPQGLFAYFIAGFLAPRASYLVGMILGLLSGALYGIAIVATLPVGTDVAPDQAALSIVSYMVTGAVLGTFAGGFAAWYRNFLRNMQQNSNKKRGDKETQEREKRRAARQASRSVFKGRS